MIEILSPVFLFSLLFFVGGTLLMIVGIQYSTLSLTTFIKPIFGMLIGFLKIIMNGFGSLFSTIFSSFGSAIAIMMQSFGFSSAQYGILGPTAFVAGLGLAFLIGYLLLVPGDAERDIVEDESEV